MTLTLVSNDPLTILMEEGLLDAHSAEAIRQTQAIEGGSLLNAIASQPDLNINQLWANLAKTQDRLFLPNLRAASPIHAMLISREDATRFLVLGRVVRYQQVHLITPDPFLRLRDLEPLRQVCAPFVPGNTAQLRIEVCTPLLWKELYAYSYPQTRYTTPLSEEEAIAMASLTPARYLEGKTLDQLRTERAITDEQYAEAYAKQLGQAYINLKLAPPNPDLEELIPPQVVRSTGLYPYEMTRDGYLIVVCDRLPTDLTTQRFRLMTGYPILPAICNPSTYSTLMEAVELATRDN